MQDLPTSDRMFIPKVEARAGGRKVEIKHEKGQQGKQQYKDEQLPPL